jgi:UDP-4-amino-4-deoxy-L-arabinose formyltransferase/UDP-glucuronic acid dehydrogenase (UDP-4-keto-hexauronic acid decarboxylating)
VGSTKAILCGYQWAGCKALDELIKKFDEVYVYTHPSPNHLPDLVALCEEKQVPYSIEKISIENLPFIPEIICSIYYRYLVSEEVIAAVDGKIFNLHPSLLPKYRGCSSLTWAMINEEPQAGYSYHYIDADCDTGNIIVQEAFNIETWDTQQTVYQRAMEMALTDFTYAVDFVLDNRPGQLQQGTASYYPRGCPHDGIISDDWNENRIKAFIKAMINPPLPVATYKGHPVNSYEEFERLIGEKE